MKNRIVKRNSSLKRVSRSETKIKMKVKPSSLKRRPVRSWTLATRLEHRRIKGKNNKK
ncbi:MAG: hypothetical protein Q8P74_01320 [bacterium]|nr:hypothetical protein [bacterium]